MGDGDVVKARQGHVFGHPQARFTQGRQAAHGQHVVGGKDGVGARLALRDAAPRDATGFFGEVAFEDQRLHARFQAAAVATQPFLRFMVALWPADEGDALGAAGHQVARHGPGAAEVVDHEAGVAGQRGGGVQQHGRQAARQVVLQESGVGVGRHDDQAIDPAVHRAHGLGGFVGIAV